MSKPITYVKKSGMHARRHLYQNDIYRSLKKQLQRIGCVYRVCAFLKGFLAAVVAIRVDFTPVREFFVYVHGGQNLDKKTYRFYKTFAEGIWSQYEGQPLHFVDVGGNNGWFAKTVMRFFPDARITCYEPLKSQCAYLERLSRTNSKFHYRSAAVGDARGTCNITEYGTSGLSTLKKIDDCYEFPSEYYSQSVVGVYPVEVVRLDDDLPPLLHEDEIVILKVDTQGSELEVLKGASHLLRRRLVRYIIIELMTVRKYTGAALYNEIFEFLHRHGYTLHDVHPFYYEQPTKKLSEFDAVFVSDL